MSARDAAQVDVFKGDQRVGTLARSEHGARFTYAPAYAAAHPADPARAVAVSLPVRSEPYDVFGVNLHPFFAGLLPEGLRLRALARALKTSEDDLFSLLVASGGDTVGDVAVAPTGELPREHAPSADVARLDQVSFAELFAESIAEHGVTREASVAGVQPKLSAAMIALPLRARGKRRAYILKLTPAEYPRLSENEVFFMGVARRAGIPTAALQLVRDREGASGVLVERFDRRGRAGAGLERLAQEDACQLLGRYPADKYRLSLSEVAAALEVCSAPLPERLALLRLQAFSYLIANGDMHAKNVSVQARDGRVSLTPAYDLLSTLPYGDERMALAMEGRDARLKAAHFIALGERHGVRAEAVRQMLSRLTAKVAPAADELAAVGLDARKTEHLARTMRARLAALSP